MRLVAVTPRYVVSRAWFDVPGADAAAYARALECLSVWAVEVGGLPWGYVALSDVTAEGARIHVRALAAARREPWRMLRVCHSVLGALDIGVLSACIPVERSSAIRLAELCGFDHERTDNGVWYGKRRRRIEVAAT